MAAVLGGGTIAREREQRVLALAVVASLALHAVLLFTNFLQRGAARKPDAVPVPVVARLMVPRPAPPPPAAPSRPPVEARPVVKQQPVAAPVARVAPTELAVQPKPESAAPPSEVANPVPDLTPRAPPSVPSLTPTAPGPVARIDRLPAPPPSPAASDDAGTLDQYRLAIYSAARRYKKYPRVALDNNWEGKAVIRLVIGANGLIASISITTSTGHDVLDQAALETLTRAKPQVPIPAALRGKEFGMDINFIYSLKDERA